jgi:hypothetical protein
MAENESRGTTPWLAFLVGGLIVAVAVIGYFVYAGGGSRPTMPESVDVDVNLPKAPQIPDAPRLPDAPVPAPK